MRTDLRRKLVGDGLAVLQARRDLDPLLVGGDVEALGGPIVPFWQASRTLSGSR
ncbi:MAG: hypothetical protein MUC77_17995 [Chromatiaceae bacterium]|jgi:hypothetical protein|nr:hypothetical protein [Chromatiaceae bacterium]